MTSSTALRLFFAFIFSICSLLGASAVSAQACPTEDNNGVEPLHPVTLHGRIIYHDALRQWFGFRPDKPICGQTEVQISANPGQIVRLSNGRHARMEELRNCMASVTGPLFITPTGYYSSALEQVLGYIHPDRSCVRQSRFPDPSHAIPDPRIRSYHVTYAVSHRGEGSIHPTVTQGGRQLKPWEAYTHSWLTGSFVLYGYCANSYEISHISGSPEANPDRFYEMAAIDADPEKKVEPILMTFTCTRKANKNAAPN